MTEATPATPAAAAPTSQAPATPAASQQATSPDDKSAVQQAAAVAEAKRKLKLGDKELELSDSDLAGLLKQVKHRAKIDGKEVEVDYDQLIKDYQLGHAAQKRMMDADVTRRQAEELIRLAKTDPRKLLQHPSINADLRKLAEEVLAEQIQEQMMDPKDKEIRDHKKKLEQYEQQLKQQQTAALRQVYQGVAQQLGEPVAQAAVAILQEQKAQITPQALIETAQEYVKQQQTVLQQVQTAATTAGLPDTPDARRRIAYYMHQGVLQGLEIPADKAASLVKQDYVNEIKTLLGSAPSDALLGMLGDEMTTKVVKSHLEKAKKPGVTPAKTDGAPRPRSEKRDQPKRFKNRDEWEKALNERLGK